MRELESPDFYRARAGEMRAMAEKAQTPVQVASYIALAEDWERLADKAEQAKQRAGQKT